MARTESEMQKEKARMKNLRALHCAFWMNSLCYEPKRLAALSETQGRKVESAWCFKDTKAKYCNFFQKRSAESKTKMETATQKTMF